MHPFTLTTGSLLFLVFSLMTAAARPARSEVEVVTTSPDLADIARNVGGDKVKVISLARGSQNPHFVDPRPSFMVKLRGAQLFIINGLDMEIGWVPPLLNGARNARINVGGPGFIDASRGIQVVEVPARDVTRAEGDIHPFGNPHYLLDPLNGKVVAATIATALKGVDPGSSEVYDAHLGKFQDAIDRAVFGSELVDEVGGAKLDRLARSGELDSFLESSGAAGKLGGWMAALKPLRSTPIVTYHRNLSYFAQRFGIEVAGYIELKPGIPPSAKHLVDVVALMKSRGIHIIATQPFYDERAPAMVAEKSQAKVIAVPSSTDQVSGADTYLDLFNVIVRKLTGAEK